MSPARKTRPRRGTGWLLVLGLGLAVWVVWALATAPRGRPPVSESGGAAAGKAGKSSAEAPSADIGDESRAALREILRSADDEEEDAARAGRR